MDPYLEDPGRWPGVHHRLITSAADALAVQLRPKYFAEIEERGYVSAETDRGRRVFIEIDLLRDGVRFTGAPREPPADYVVYLSRRTEGDRRRSRIWPIRLHQRLPVIPVPLRDPDPDAQLDLQQVLNTIYHRASYDLDIDYSRPPHPPLTGEQAAWARPLIGRD